MHLEVLVEDKSCSLLLENLLPKIIGQQGKPHTWRIHSYKGIGHLPKNLKANANIKQRHLLTQLPRLLSGYSKPPVMAKCWL